VTESRGIQAEDGGESIRQLEKSGHVKYRTILFERNIVENCSDYKEVPGGFSLCNIRFVRPNQHY